MCGDSRLWAGLHFGVSLVLPRTQLDEMFGSWWDHVVLVSAVFERQPGGNVVTTPTIAPRRELKGTSIDRCYDRAGVNKKK